MQRFDPSSFYKVTSDESIIQEDYDNSGVSLSEKRGRDVIHEYLKEKYDVNIIEYEIDLRKEESRLPHEYMAKAILKLLDNARKESKEHEEYRQLFFIINLDIGHATPVLYLKEKSKEAILISDSVYPNSETAAEVKKQCPEQNLEVLYTKDINRQTDNFSCYADTFIFGRDGTGKLNGRYIFAELLLALEQNKKVDNNGCFLVQLTNVLLKAVQYAGYGTDPSFDKYTDKSILITTRSKPKVEVDLLAYLRKKGIKLAHKIAMKFYLNQLAALLGPNWNKELESKFNLLAKKRAKEIWLNEKQTNKHKQLLDSLYGTAVTFYVNHNPQLALLQKIYQILESENIKNPKLNPANNFKEYLDATFICKDEVILKNGKYPSYKETNTAIEALAVMAQTYFNSKKKPSSLLSFIKSKPDDTLDKFYHSLIKLTNSQNYTTASNEIHEMFLNTFQLKNENR